MKTFSLFAVVFVAGAVAGCSKSNSATNATSSAASSAEGGNYLSDAPLEGAVGVGEAKKADNDGDEITLIGRIGGSESPFIDGLAAFTIVDPKVEHCAAEEGCPTPWDYCCTTDQLPDNTATITLVDDTGKPLPRSAKDVLGIGELALVTIRGKAKRDNAGNLTVTADRIHVEKDADHGHDH